MGANCTIRCALCRGDGLLAPSKQITVYHITFADGTAATAVTATAAVAMTEVDEKGTVPGKTTQKRKRKRKRQQQKPSAKRAKEEEEEEEEEKEKPKRKRTKRT